ncbi:Kinesin-like protein [Hondaea fermentalgiana]|uniref:Kinesin-like protein n=1 Tax=Hondaea fermentalgiana TaxID=2315210 RepID=A0A2R5GE32_9STRA|nr:Kinesin-like protein [Hondaea fermentalgiana]|eukprot:GBG28835.1 Kinesin-like protein [Hondaea fermentalgiana]
MNVEVLVRLVAGPRSKRRGSRVGDDASLLSDDLLHDEFKEDQASSTALQSGFKVFDVDAVHEVPARVAESHAGAHMDNIFNNLVRPVVEESQRTQKTGLILMQGCAHRDDFAWMLRELVVTGLRMGGPHAAVRLSGTEIWNETTRDLISPETQEEHVLASKGSSVKVRAAEDVTGLVSLLQKRRKRMRGHKGFLSHLVVTLSWDDECSIDLVDLADPQGGEDKDQRNIKKSRLALEKVLSALNQPSTLARGGHVPFRDSKLTRVLQPTLLQPSRVVLVATVSDAEADSIGTLGTLEFCNNIRRSKRARRTSTISTASSHGFNGIMAGDVHSVAGSEYSKQSFSTLCSSDGKPLGMTIDESRDATAGPSDGSSHGGRSSRRSSRMCSTAAASRRRSTGDMRTSAEPGDSFGQLQRDNRAKARLINILASETVGKGDAIKSLVQESRDKQQALELAQEELAAQREIILQMRGQIEEQQLQIEQLQEHGRRISVRSASSETAALSAHRELEDRVAAMQKENEILVAQAATAAEEFTTKLQRQSVEIEALRADLGLAKAEEANVRIQHDAELSALQEAFKEEKTGLKREAINLAHEVCTLEKDHDRFQIEAAASARAALCAEMRAVGEARAWALRARCIRQGAVLLLKAALRSHDILRSDLRTALGAAATFRLAAALGGAGAGAPKTETSATSEEHDLQADLQNQINRLETALRERDATIDSLEAFLLSPPSTPFGGGVQSLQSFQDGGFVESPDVRGGASEDWAEIARLRAELEAARLRSDRAQDDKQRVLEALEHKNGTISQLSAERNTLAEEKDKIMREAFKIVAWLQGEDDRKSKLLASLLKESGNAQSGGIVSLAPLLNPFSVQPCEREDSASRADQDQGQSKSPGEEHDCERSVEEKCHQDEQEDQLATSTDQQLSDDDEFSTPPAPPTPVYRPSRALPMPSPLASLD